MEILRLQKTRPISPCNTGRKSTDSSSPEFDFWRQQNPSFNEPNILSADELFVDGVLLPLHLLHLHHSDEPPDNPLQEQPAVEKISPLSDPEIGLTASKRWTDIFKKSEWKQSDVGENREKDKKKDKRKGTDIRSGGGGGGGGGGVPAELNINIWPFSRSRSAGNNGNKPKIGSGSAATRKVSSAPCSRSNSRGESKSRKWPNSPTRSGVHLGRSSPVWQIRRVSVGKLGPDLGQGLIRRSDSGDRKEEKEVRRKKSTVTNSDGSGMKTRVLNINVPTCMSYRQHLSCRSVESSAVTAAYGGGIGSSDQSGGGGGGESTDSRRTNLFNLRNLFIRKVH